MSRLPVTLLLLVVLAGCGGAREVAPERLPWTLPNVCNGGGVRCIDAVVAEMTRRFDPLAAACDHRAPFALMYLRVTEAVGREERSGSLRADRNYLSHLDAVFARLYFEAADAWCAILREASTRFDPSIAGFRLPVLDVDAATVGLLIGGAKARSRMAAASCGPRHRLHARR